MTITVSEWSWGRLAIQAFKQFQTYADAEDYDQEVHSELRAQYEHLYEKAKAAGEMS